MSKHWLYISCSLVLFVGAGCSNKSSMRYASQDANNNGPEFVIFNPDFVLVPPQFVGRADWPATSTYQITSETVEYRESIIDNDNSGYGHQQDGYRRRFYSTRKGKQVR